MISVVIPARDEIDSVAGVVRAVSAALAAVPHEVLVIDDGSSDGTGAAAAAAGARVLRTEGLGYGAAIKRAARVARGDRIAIIDADGSYPPAALPALAAALDRGARHVIGARPALGGAESLFRSATKTAFRLAVLVWTGVAIPDLNSGMRMLRTADLRAMAPILPDRFSLTTTLTLALAAEGDAPVFVPIEYRPRSGRSKWRPVRDTWLMGRTVLRGIGWLRSGRAPRALPAWEAPQP